MSICFVAEASWAFVGLALELPPPPLSEPPHAAATSADADTTTANSAALLERTNTTRLLTAFVVCTISPLGLQTTCSASA